MNGPPDQSNAGTSSGIGDKISSGVKNVADTVSGAATDMYNSASENISDASEYVKQSMDGFSSTSVAESGSSFLESNTIVAKFAFLILVLIAFMFLVNLGVMLIGYFTKPKNNPYLVSGTMNAANSLTITQDPKNTNSVQILRSNNQNTGIEFTWAVWIFINDINPPSKPPQFSNIFNKGNGTYGPDGFATVNNGPGLYLDNSGHQLVIAMNTVSINNPTEYLYIKDMPLRKWFHCSIRMENTVLDTYINGVIAGRLIMQDVPKQNYENVYVCNNGGFNGNIADLQYYDYALSVFQINNIVVWGRNTKASNASGTADATGFPYYLSNLWYSSNY